MAFGSLLTGVSGLKANQETLDIVGNNLANANTPAFKSQRARFADLFYQTLAPATPATAVVGGTNPEQLGFGTKVASIDSNFAQGVLDPTSRDLDAGIQGQGFFALSDGVRTFFSRAGSFSVDNQGTLVDPSTGFNVVRFGNIGEPTATSQGFQKTGDMRIKVPLGTGTPGTPTTAINFRGNLSANAAVGDTVPTAVQVYDAQGTGHVLSLTFTKTATNKWTLTGSIPPAEGSLTDGSVGPIEFGDNGAPTTFNGDVVMKATFNGITAAQTITFNLGTVGAFDGVTQFGGNSSAAAVGQDGFASGALTTVNIGKDGIINGVFTNGKVIPLAQLGLAMFNNPAGLDRQGNNLYSVTTQSGEALIGPGQTAGRGSVQQGTLEGSNVDVATEFTQLIIAQRGFQVNARTITVSDQVLQELANIIR